MVRLTRKRQFFRQYVVVGQADGVTVEYKGEQLNQDDHDTFLQLVKMALHHPLGGDLEQAVNAVLRGLGRSNNQEQRRQLFAQVSRLVSGTVRLSTPSVRYEGHLLDDASTPQDQAELPRLRRRLAYRLNPRFARLYAESAYTLFDAQERLKLKGRGSELAKWLYLWIIGNAQQYPHKVETIRRLCGSKLEDLNEFRRNLRRALDLLQAAGAIVAWRIDEADLVHIERTPSESQQKHLANKAKKPKREKTTWGMESFIVKTYR
ncbi:MAG: plasmid replication initiator TrfA [Zwartia sp.]